MQKTIYEDLILALISAETLAIEIDENFNHLAFRSAFYRFKKTEIGGMLLVGLELRIRTALEPQESEKSQESFGPYSPALVHVATLTLAPISRPEFKIRSQPNAPI